jgi:hypothetical protein
MDEKFNDDRLNRLWQHGLHEDKIFNDRLNFFLVFESVLLSVVALIRSSPNNNPVGIAAIILHGLLITILWTCVQAKQKHTLQIMKQQTLEVDRDYKKIVELRKGIKWPFSITWIFTYAIPGLVGMIWLILLFTI